MNSSGVFPLFVRGVWCGRALDLRRRICGFDREHEALFSASLAGNLSLRAEKLEATGELRKEQALPDAVRLLADAIRVVCDDRVVINPAGVAVRPVARVGDARPRAPWESIASGIPTPGP